MLIKAGECGYGSISVIFLTGKTGNNWRKGLVWLMVEGIYTVFHSGEVMVSEMQIWHSSPPIISAEQEVERKQVLKMAWKTSSFLPQGPTSSIQALLPKGLLDIPEQFHELSVVRTHDDDVCMLFTFKLQEDRQVTGGYVLQKSGRRGLGFALWRMSGRQDLFLWKGAKGRGC